MEALRLHDRSYIDARYREVEAEWQRHGRNSEKKAAAGDGRVDGAVDEDDGDLTANETQRLSNGPQRALLSNIHRSTAAYCARSQLSCESKRLEVVRVIFDSLYSEREHLSSVIAPAQPDTARNSTSTPYLLDEMDVSMQFALRMFFRLCTSLQDPARMDINLKLAIQVATRLPTILTSVPSCILSPGFTDDTADTSGCESGNVVSVFSELFRLFDRLLNLPNDRKGHQSSSHHESGVSTATSSQRDQGRLSANDHGVVSVAYLALSLKLGRLRHILVAIRYLLDCDQDAISPAQLQQLAPLLQDISTSRAEFPAIPFEKEEILSGFLMSFGKGDHGKLGHGQCSHQGCQDGNCTENKVVPTYIEATRAVKFAKIDSLSTHSIAITTAGEVMAWGNGDKYRLGHGSPSKEYVPRVIEALSMKGRVRDIACGLGHTLALMESGELYAWGNGSNGRLGLGDTSDRAIPTMVEPSSMAIAGSPQLRSIFCGASHSMAISWDGRAYTWGKNNQGQCGLGHTNDQLSVKEVSYFVEEVGETIVHVAGGWEHSLFCSGSGRVYSCGCGYKDSRRTGVPPVLGHGDYERRLKPSLILVLADLKEDIVKVTCGWDHSIALSASGQVFTWGSGTNGKLGHGDEESCETPTLVRDLTDVVAIDAKAGCEHTMLLTANHEVWTFGHGDSGRLGHGDSQTKKSPTKIDQFSTSKLKPVAIAAGDKYNLVLVDECDSGSQKRVSANLRPTRKLEKGNGHLQYGDGTSHDRQTGRLSHVYEWMPANVDRIMKQFQYNWSLDLIEERPQSANQGQPSTVREVVLYIFGHLDRIASEYVSKYDAARAANCQHSTPQQQVELLPFAIDTSAEAFGSILELLQNELSMLSTTKNNESENSQLKQGFSICDGSAVMMSLFRILQINLLKAAESSCCVPTGNDSPHCVSPELMVLVQKLHALALDVAGNHTIPNEVAARCSDHAESTPGNDSDAMNFAIRFEAAMVLKAGFVLFYPQPRDKLSLLKSLVDIKESSDSAAQIRPIVLAMCLCQDAAIEPVVRLAFSGEQEQEIRDKVDDNSELTSLILSLVESSCEQAAVCQLNSNSSGVNSRWPCQMLQVLQMHLFSLARRRLAAADAITTPSQAAISPFEFVIKYLETILKRARGLLEGLNKLERQVDARQTELFGAAFLRQILPTAVDGACVLLKSGNDAACSDLVHGHSVWSNLFALKIVEVLLPELSGILPLLNQLNIKIGSERVAGNNSTDTTMLGCGDVGGGIDNPSPLIECGKACADMYGMLCCELLRPALHTSSVTNDWSEGNSSQSHQTECNTLKRILALDLVDGLQDCADIRINEPADLTTNEEVLIDDNSIMRAAVFCRGLAIASNMLKALSVSSIRTSMLQHIAAEVVRNGQRSSCPPAFPPRMHDAITDSMRTFYTQIASIVGDKSTALELKKQALIVWCVPLTISGLSNSSVSTVISVSRIVGFLSELLLSLPDDCSALGESRHACPGQINHANAHQYLGQEDIRTCSASLSPKLKPALSGLMETCTQMQCGVRYLAWQALYAVGLQLAGTREFRQIGPTVLLHPRDSSPSMSETSGEISSSTIDHSIDRLVDTLFCHLKRIWDTLSNMEAVSRHLGELMSTSTASQHRPRIFLLGNPLVASSSRKQTVGLEKTPFVTNGADCDHNRVSAKSTALSISLWVFLNEPPKSQNTIFENAPDAAHPTPTFGEESVCLVAMGDGDLNVLRTSGSISSAPANCRAGLTIWATLTANHTMSLSLAVTTQASDNLVQWHTALVSSDIALGQWIHMALVLSSTKGSHIQAFVDGKAAECSIPPPSDSFFAEACSWSSVSIGGHMNTTSPIPDKQHYPTEPPRCELSTVVDDLWITDHSCLADSIRTISDGGPLLYQLKSKATLEYDCSELVQVVHALMVSDSTTASCSDGPFSSHWIDILIELLLSRWLRWSSASQVCACELLSCLLPLMPVSESIDLTTIGKAYHVGFGTETTQERRSALDLFAYLHDDEHNEHTADDLSQLSKRRQIIRAILISGKRGVKRDLRGHHSLAGISDNRNALAEIAGEQLDIIKYSSVLRILRVLAYSDRWSGDIAALINQAAIAIEPPASSNQAMFPLTISASLVAGYPETVLREHVRHLALPDKRSLQIATYRTDELLSSLLKPDRVGGSIVLAIQNMLSNILGSGAWQSQSFPSQGSSRSGLVPHAVAETFNIRTRLVRFLASQLNCDGDQVWRTFVISKPDIWRFLFETASTRIVDFAISAFNVDADVNGALNLEPCQSFLTVLQDRERWQYASPQIIDELESLQWKWRQHLAELPTDFLSWEALYNRNDPKSPLEIVAGTVDIYGCQVYARENFPTIKLPTSCICANSGLWFYEVLLLTDGLMQIGFIDSDFTADAAQGQGVGDHSNSWAFDGYRRKKWNITSQDYGERWRASDVVGVLLDTDRMEISFFLNGNYLGVAFSAPQLASGGLLFPAISLNVFQLVRLNLGPTSDEMSAKPTFELLQELCSSSFSFWPRLSSVQDQQRLKPVVLATISVGSESELASSQRWGQNNHALRHGDSNDDDIDSITDIDHGSDSVRDNSSIYVADEEEDAEGEEEASRPTILGERSDIIRLRDSQERLQAVASNLETVDAEMETKRRRDLVDGLTALGFPFEWALRCALETKLTMGQSGTVSWVLEQMEKQATDTGDEIGRVPRGAVGDEGEFQVTSHSILDGTDESSHSVHRSAYNAPSSSQSILTSEQQANHATGDDIQRRAQCDADDLALPAQFSTLTQATEDSVTDEHSMIFTDSGDSNLLEATLEDYFAPDLSNSNEQLKSLESLVHLHHSSVPASCSGSTAVADRINGRLRASVLPLCVLVDASLSVCYSRVAALVLLSNLETAASATDLYRLVREWTSDTKGVAQLCCLLRVGVGLDSREPQPSVECINYSRYSPPALALQHTMLILLKAELEYEMTIQTAEAPPMNTFPLFRVLFRCIQQLTHVAIGNAKARIKQPRSEHFDTSTETNLDVMWFAWIAAIVYGHTESIFSAPPKTNACLCKFAAVASSTCYSLPYFHLLISIATAPSASTVPLQWKYAALKVVSRIIVALRGGHFMSPEVVSIRHASNCPEDSSAAPISWFPKPSPVFFKALPVNGLLEQFASRYQREIDGCVYASDTTSAIFEVLVHLSKSDVDPLADCNLVSASSNREIQVEGYSSTNATLSWRKRPVSGTTEHVLESGSSEESDHHETAILSLDYEVCKQSLLGDTSPEPTKVSPRVVPGEGTTTIRGLRPDTIYTFRFTQVHRLESDGDANENTTDQISGQTIVRPTSVVALRTLPEPLFELDRASTGKNLVMFNHNLSVKNVVNKKWHSVRSSAGFSEGIHQWQVRVDVCVSKNIFIGVCTAQASMENYIGSDAFGYGFLANKAIWNNKTKLHSYGEIFKQGDVIRVTLDCNAKTLAFSRNGEFLGVAATNMHVASGKSNSTSHAGAAGNANWYPAVSLYNKDDQVTLVPPSPGVPDTVHCRPQYSSVHHLTAEAKSFLVYRAIATRGLDAHIPFDGPDFPTSTTELEIHKSFALFQRWQRGHTVFRETALGRVIVFDSNPVAMDKYQLHKGDSIFTSDGQCVVLGEYEHQLWYELESFDPVKPRECQPEVSSWSLSTCAEMTRNPEDYPVHRQPARMGDVLPVTGVVCDTDELMATGFRDCQSIWNQADDMVGTDASIIAAMDRIAVSRGFNSPFDLSFAEIATAMQTDQGSSIIPPEVYKKHVEICNNAAGNCILARMGYLLSLNIHLYAVVRLILPRNHFGRSFPRTIEGQPKAADADQQEIATVCTPSLMTAALATALHSPYGIKPSSADLSSVHATRLVPALLFQHQRDRLIDEDLDYSKTLPLESDSSKTEETGDSANFSLPVIDVAYPSTGRSPTFWETPSSRTTITSTKRSRSLFPQIAAQLTSRSSEKWRHQQSQPFDAIPINQAFIVQVANSSVAMTLFGSFDMSEHYGKAHTSGSNQGQQHNGDEDKEQTTADTDPTFKYLQLFEHVVREVQSPAFPLFVPTTLCPESGCRHGDVHADVPVQLDVNTTLFVPSIVENCCADRSELLGWYFCFGQLLGIAWRSRLLLPLEFITLSFWTELADPTTVIANSDREWDKDKDDEMVFRVHARHTAVDAIRNGLLSIVPSRCLTLCGGGRGVRDRLSDVNVRFVSTLYTNALFSQDARHHETFWAVVRGFTSLERRLLAQFLTAGKIPTAGVEGTVDIVLELADALHDGRDHPDACYPVVTVVNGRTRRIHLPEYSSAAAMRSKLLLAMTNLSME